MSRPWNAALGLFVLAAAPCALAQGIGQGDFEAGASISVAKGERNTTAEVCNAFGCFESEIETDTEYGVFQATFGYFILDVLELKASVAETITTDFTYGIFSPGADFVFLGRSGGVAPFVGAAYGLTFGDADIDPTDSDFIDLHGGIKFFFRERASFEVKLTRYQPIDSEALTGRTDLSAGINVYF